MTALHIDQANRHPFTSRKDHRMFSIEQQLAEVQRRHAHERSLRAADRRASKPGRSIRSRIGESIIRLGRRVAGESLGSPALTG
jgi:hypothetical protein